MSIRFGLDQTFFLETKTTSYIIKILSSGHIENIYWGKKIKTLDLNYFTKEEMSAEIGYIANTDNLLNYRIELCNQEFSNFGNTDLRVPSLIIEYQDGSTISDFRYYEHQILDEKTELKGLPSLSNEVSSSLIITLKDSIRNIFVDLIYGVFENQDILTKSIRVRNLSSKKIKLNKIASAQVDFSDSEFDILHLPGSWGRERNIEKNKLVTGITSFNSVRGTSSHQENPFIALVDKNVTEYCGNVYSMSLIYSGNFETLLQKDQFGQTRMQMGINSFNFCWNINDNESFQSPEAILNYSNDGLNGIRENFYNTYQHCFFKSSYRNKVRPILINNWEATYFNFSREKLLNLASEASNLGIELFVLDDGWFGSRDDDTSSLGDWIVNEEKLGGTLSSLISDINDKGLKFGIWIEPEMVSPNSELYKKHSEWIVQDSKGRATLFRNQLILDLVNPEVQDFIINTISKLLMDYKIDYIKWDMNRTFTENGSTCLSSENQGEFSHRYILGLYRILDELTSKFNSVLFENCAGGGGRFDPGMLYYMPQTWASDNTDAVSRLEIQKGTALIYPNISMGAHISESPNHQIGRKTSLKTRGIVAMQGNLGYELNLEKLTLKDKKTIKNQVIWYKENRKTIQLGNYYQMCTKDNEYAWLNISADRQKVIFSYVQLLNSTNRKRRRIKLNYLEPEEIYIQEDFKGRVLKYGSELMEIGISIPNATMDFFSYRCRLEIVKDNE